LRKLPNQVFWIAVGDGIVFGEYYLLGRLATGGMAEVFLGKSLALGTGNQLLAVKKLLPHLSEDPSFVSMFIDEARIVSGLSHANICRVSDQGQHEGQLFMVMEFIHGKDLRELKRRARGRNERIPFGIVAHVVATIAEALDHAHNAVNEAGQPESIIHRDVSPQNILVSYDGIPKLIDFGVAKAKRRLVKTRVGVVKGNFSYMSPEQATGQEVDARTDIFTLGVVLYELLTGRLPFAGSDDFSTLERIACAEYIPPRAVAANLPVRLSTIIETAMQKDPANRFATAGEMAKELRCHLADEPRDVTNTLLSSYLRRLFRDDYICEMARVKTFLDTAPPAEAIAAANNRMPLGTGIPPTRPPTRKRPA
jgi:serine/threonine protein kinase